MTPETAIEIVAQQLLYDGEPDWENYPDIGEYDWDRIIARVEAMKSYPQWEQFCQAYEILKVRANVSGRER